MNEKLKEGFERNAAFIQFGNLKFHYKRCYSNSLELKGILKYVDLPIFILFQRCSYPCETLRYTLNVFMKNTIDITLPNQIFQMTYVTRQVDYSFVIPAFIPIKNVLIQLQTINCRINISIISIVGLLFCAR